MGSVEGSIWRVVRTTTPFLVSLARVPAMPATSGGASRQISKTGRDSADAGARAGRARSRSQAARRGGCRSTGRTGRAPGRPADTGTISTGRTSQNHSPEETRRWTAVCASLSERVSRCDQRSPRPSRWNEPSVHQASPSWTIAATAMANRSHPSARNTTIDPPNGGAHPTEAGPSGEGRCPACPPRYKGGEFALRSLGAGGSGQVAEWFKAHAWKACVV